MSKVRYWNSDILDITDSKEDYLVIETNILIQNEDNRIRKAPAYIHEKSGIITTDIEAFEVWLEKIGGLS